MVVGFLKDLEGSDSALFQLFKIRDAHGSRVHVYPADFSDSVANLVVDRIDCLHAVNDVVRG